MTDDENRPEEIIARFKAEEPQRRAQRALIPHADYDQWNDYVDALQRDRDALTLARQSGALDLDELAEALDNLLDQMHFMARACRNALGPVPSEIRRIDDYVRPWRRIRRWIANLRPAQTKESKHVTIISSTNPLDPPVDRHGPPQADMP